jgi:hypothetical protein
VLSRRAMMKATRVLQYGPGVNLGRTQRALYRRPPEG